MERTKERIKEDVIKHFLWDNRLEGESIDVEVNGSMIVILKGEVSSHIVRQAAEEDALIISDVAGVDNKLKVKSEIIDIAKLDDGKLNKIIKDIFDLYPSFDNENISIDVKNKEVHLSGSIDSYWKKLRAEELIHNIKGVKKVKNMLSVVPSKTPRDQTIADDIVSAFKRINLFDLSAVNIEVNGGEVTLNGTVPNWYSYSTAFAVAQYTRGVVNVENKLIIQS